MKKFLVVLVVVALTCLSSMAFAADVTLGGSYEIRSRMFDSLGFDKLSNATDVRDTQNRIRLDVNAKAGDVKGKLELESDFGSGASDWGTGSDAYTLLGGGAYSTSAGQAVTGKVLGFREAWVNFNLPGIPVNVTAGRQLVQLGNGWFLRSMHYGTDAWVAANVTGNNTFAVADGKVLEGAVGVPDDIDLYAVLDVIKLSDTAMVGIDVAAVKDRRNNIGLGGGTQGTDLNNIGVNFNGKLGPVALKAEVDMQMGKAKDVSPTADHKFKGNQVVIQGNVALDPVTVNFTAARGSGNKLDAFGAPTSGNYKNYVNFLDIDPHYTFLYEYKLATAGGSAHDGFSNTTALSVGASVAAGSSLTLGADIWMLSATEKIMNGMGALSSKVGNEVDVKANWKLSDNLAWNWNIGYFKPGAAFKTAAGKTDKATGIQGVLAFKF